MKEEITAGITMNFLNLEIDKKINENINRLTLE